MHDHAWWTVNRIRWPYYDLIPQRWRTVVTCLSCGERGRVEDLEQAYASLTAEDYEIFRRDH